MASDLVHLLLITTLASSLSILLVLILRKAMRACFSAPAAYGLWALVPLSAAAALLPAPVVSMSLQVLPPAATDLIMTAVPMLAPQAVASGIFLSAWLTAVWLLGSTVSLLAFAAQQRRFVRRLGTLTPA